MDDDDQKAIEAARVALRDLNSALAALPERDIGVELDVITSRKIADRAPARIVVARLTRTKTEIDVTI